MVVEGAHGVGKSEFAASLAEELEMHYLPAFTHEDYYVDDYGNDLRHYEYLLFGKLKTFDDK